MATTWTFTRSAAPADGIVGVHPPQLLRARGPESGTAGHSGAFRSVRGTLTAAGTYATGGDFIPTSALQAAGITFLEAVILILDKGAAPAAVPGVPRYNTATQKMELYTLAGVELAAAAATTGSYEVLLLGKG